MVMESRAPEKPDRYGAENAGYRAAMQQRIIDHEVRLSRAAALVHDYLVQRRGRAEARLSWEQTVWLRRQLAEMIADAPKDELHALGLTDEMVREARLGDSLEAAWNRLHGTGAGLPF